MVLVAQDLNRKEKITSTDKLTADSEELLQ
jgi:hypothetical protein